MPLTARGLGRSLSIRSGKLRPQALTAYGIMRDEMFFLPAWLDHHRGLGVEQFLIVDDGSEDGTGDYLAAQPDVVTLGTPHRFGDPVRLPGLIGVPRRDRVGIALKEVVPKRFLPGRIALCLDADEFVLLPAGLDLGDVLATMRARRSVGIAAAVVEFFPDILPPPGVTARPQTLAALMDLYGWFEPEPLVRLRRWRGPRLINASKSTRLYLAHGLGAGTAHEPPSTPRLKTPLVHHRWGIRRFGSHRITARPDPQILLTVAHFVWTHQIRAKIDRARAWKAHLNGARKYGWLSDLVKTVDASGGPLLSERSRRYSGPDQLIAAGLMAWPDL